LVSKEVAAGDPKEIVGAVAGDFVLPRNGERILVKAQVGYPFLILTAWIGWPEYLPARGGFVAPHETKPRNAVWHKAGASSDGKEGLYLVDIDGNPGNRIEETIYVRVLVLPDDDSAPFIVTQAFKSTAKTIGNDMLNRATRKVNGKDTNPVTVKWRMTSRLERKGDQRWFAPNPTLIGRLGEPNGPNTEEVRLGAQLRKSLKQGDVVAWEAALEPPEPTPAPASVQRRAPITVTSGRSALRGVETAPPLEHDGGPDDESDYENTPF
jgi:hypothetical protein